MCWEQTLWNGDQTCMMSGPPAESLEPFAVEMRQHLSTDMHRAAISQSTPVVKVTQAAWIRVSGRIPIA